MLTGILLLWLAAAPTPPPFALDAPRSYAGVIPCADCEGIRLTLNLFPDHSCAVRNEYLGKNRSSSAFGRWSVEEGGALALRGGTEAPQFFRVVDAETLRKLDSERREIATKLNYDLKRDPEFRLIEDSVPALGLFRYMADAGRITLCATAREIPVALEGANAALEKAYGEKKPGPGEPLLVAVTGHLAFRPKVDGKGTDLVFVVDAFGRALPGEPCNPPLPGQPSQASTPEGRTWTLVSLRGEKVTGGRGRKALEIKLDATGHRLSGSTGCNRLMGRYALKGDGLTFKDVATTRMACPENVMEREQILLRTLGDVDGWKLSGKRLLLTARRETVAELDEKEDD